MGDPFRPEPGETPPYGAPQYQHYQPYQAPIGTPGYGMAAYGIGPMAPYGVDPATGQPLSDKSKLAAGLLQLLLSLFGIPGVGRLYAGHIGIGLTQLLGAIASYVLICVFIGLFTFWAFLLWGIIDGIVLLAGSNARDGQGRLMR